MSSYRYKSDLAAKCQAIAGCLTYNDGEHEDAAKRALQEAAHALDAEAVWMVKVPEGMLIANARGKRRLMTLRERFVVWVLGGNTEVRP